MAPGVASGVWVEGAVSVACGCVGRVVPESVTAMDLPLAAADVPRHEVVRGRSGPRPRVVDTRVAEAAPLPPPVVVHGRVKPVLVGPSIPGPSAGPA
jgi:hypothetical protein